MQIVRKVFAAAAVLLAASGVHANADDNVTQLEVGDTITLPAHNVLNKDYYGCFDLEDTKEAEHQRIEATMAKAGTRDPFAYGHRAIQRFVEAHRSPVNPPGPDYFRGTCGALSNSLYDTRLRIAEIYVWPDGGPRLFCLDLLDGIDVGPQPGLGDKQDSMPTPPHQTCWWTRRDVNPSLSRQTPPPAQRPEAEKI
jgi:hypothetical protein